MDWRLRLDSALYRLAIQRAGSDRALADLVRQWLAAYVATPPAHQEPRADA